MTQCAFFGALLGLCGWISIPLGDVAFTLQTFGLFLTLLLLEGKWGTAAVTVYLVLGAAGLPVFSGFRGGLGVLLGATGGYIDGFLLAALGYWLICTLFRSRPWARTLGCLAGLLLCYSAGTAWFCLAYAGNGGLSLGAVVLKCVLPYVIPDLAKLYLAQLLAKRLRPFVY